MNWLFPPNASMTEEEKKKQQEKENKEGGFVPGKISKVSKFGETHKPIKLKPQDEAYRWTPSGGFESLGVKASFTGSG
ncbi:MAG TPA: hypothetical protein VE135_04815 [Pyrinomonadaceae bacterium]|nr:hypothetical protein [Pyrinomonadaceae bacterium]